MTIGAGRPLRFLGFIGIGWIAIRIAASWQEGASLAEAVRDVLPLPLEASAAAPVAIAEPGAGVTSIAATGPAQPTRLWAVASEIPKSVPPPNALAPTWTAVSGADGTSFSAPTGVERPEILLPTSTLPATPVPGQAIKRLSVSGWIIARSGLGAGSSAFAPQLGGTQGGVRVDYAVTSAIAATARIAAPAAGAGREVSIGIAWRPAGVPLRFVAEQRIALDAGRGGPSVGVSGGVDAVRLPAGFRLEGYGQAGMIVRDGIEHFVDGSARATRPVLAVGGIALDAGVGTWGGAQRGVARLDVGPTLGARIPVAGTNLRIAIDWRQRVAGRARPGSGPAVTLGTDF